MERSILVVDDEAAVTLALEAFFQSKGYEVLRAFYGDQAIEQLERSRPSLIILDLQMKDVNGIEVLRKVRASYPKVKVLVITAYGEQFRKELGELKPEMIKQKPVSLEELTQSVKALLEQGPAPEEAASQRLAPSESLRLLFVEGNLQLYEQIIKPHFKNLKGELRVELACASEPEEALRALEEFKPHLVLLDGTRMPIGVDTGKLAAELSKGPFPPLEVILLAIPSPRSGGTSQPPAASLRQIEEAIQRAVRSHHLFPAPHGGSPDAAQ
ncbi:MAG: response regulator [Candidatus Omnitrophica bacterium]|nr:response regulator [Candidatus Omnitrophota bacterium]